LTLDESNENEDTTSINSIDVLLSDAVKTIVVTSDVNNGHESYHAAARPA